jgi:hypothetical protein
VSRTARVAPPRQGHEGPDRVRDEEAVGSNPATPTVKYQVKDLILSGSGPSCVSGDRLEEDQGGQPVRRVEGAVAVVLGRAAHQLTRVQLLDAESPGTDELRLQTDDFGPIDGLLLLLPGVDVRAQDARERLVLKVGQRCSSMWRL